MRKYDFILPLGSTCVTAHNLRKNGLQKESLPFDWIWIPSVSTITEFFNDDFTSFFRKENLQFVRNNGDADIYKDTSNHTEFWHDFMVGKNFDEIYPKIKNKYHRRIIRAYEYIDKADSILLFRTIKIREKRNKNDDHLFAETKMQTHDLINDLKALQRLFPNKKIELLLIYLYCNKHEFLEYDINHDIHICEMYNDEGFGWKGNEQQIAAVLQKYGLTYKGKLRYLINTVKFKLSKLLNVKHK